MLLEKWASLSGFDKQIRQVFQLFHLGARKHKKQGAERECYQTNRSGEIKTKEKKKEKKITISHCVHGRSRGSGVFGLRDAAEWATTARDDDGESRREDGEMEPIHQPEN